MPRPAIRENQILSLLARYGVMDTRTLKMLMGASLGDSHIRHLLRNLRLKGLVHKKSHTLNKFSANYWMLKNEPILQQAALKKGGLSADDLRHKRLHWSQVPHENLCTILHASFERSIRGLWIIREGSEGFKDLPAHIISKRVRDNGYLPDMCIGVPSYDANTGFSDGSYRWIAVELDRTDRSRDRISRRMNIYSRHTNFDGLLYLTAEELKTSKKMRRLYNDDGAKEAYRIEGGKDTFLALGVAPNRLFDPNQVLIKCGKHKIPLSSWIALFAFADVDRRDEFVRLNCHVP